MSLEPPRATSMLPPGLHHSLHYFLQLGWSRSEQL
jgi:hypothetical protein